MFAQFRGNCVSIFPKIINNSKENLSQGCNLKGVFLACLLQGFCCHVEKIQCVDSFLLQALVGLVDYPDDEDEDEDEGETSSPAKRARLNAS